MLNPLSTSQKFTKMSIIDLIETDLRQIAMEAKKRNPNIREYSEKAIAALR